MKIHRPATVVDDADVFARASIGTFFNSAGDLASAAVDVPRYDYDPTDLAKPPSLLIEKAATNLVPNGTGAGVTSGLPTTWVNGSSGSMSRNWVGSGTTKGVPYTLLRINGNPSNSSTRWHLSTSTSGTPASPGTSYTLSISEFFVNSSADSVPALGSMRIYMEFFDAGLGSLQQSSITISSGLKTLTAVAPADTAYVQVRMNCSLSTDGRTYDFTLRIGTVQLEAGPKKTSWILTSGTVQTRAADIVPDFMSTVPETPPALYNSGTTYALDVQSGVDTGIPIDVYRSLQPGNLNHDPASSPLWWKLIGTTYPVYDGTTWALGDLVIDPVTHKTYESLQGSNTGHVPGAPGSELWWLQTGPTNRWAPFDQTVNTQAQAPDLISYTFKVNALFNSLSLLNVSASAARVVIYDPVEGVIRDFTVYLASADGIDDWYDYFFAAIRRMSSVGFDDLPLYPNAWITITLIDPGQMVKVGVILTTLATEWGDTQFGSSMGIRDFSRKSTDEFGNTTVVERAFSKTGSFTVMVKKSDQNALFDELSDLRAMAVLYEGSAETGYELTAIYGFFKDFTLIFNHHNYSILNIEIEGLI